MTMNEVDDMTSEDLDRLSVSVNEKHTTPQIVVEQTDKRRSSTYSLIKFEDAQTN